MGFGGREFVFDSPAAAVAAMVARCTPSIAAGRPARSDACDLSASRGRILAATVQADRDSPAFDHSAMDGYAVRKADVVSLAAGNDQVTLRVAGEVRIGERPPALSDGAAVRIGTGAAVPPGADAILKREDVTEHAPSPPAPAAVGAITFPADVARSLKAGSHIRRRGENARAGHGVLDAGTVISSAAIGLLAAVGCTRPGVRPRVRVGIITTGDELVQPEVVPGDFQVRNSNGAVLRSLLAARAWIDAAEPRHVQDDGDALGRALRGAIAECDAVVLTGGVSMGHRDPVRSTVEAAGAQIVFHGLPQRPGKPMLGAVAHGPDDARIPILGLPGNPVSAMVTCERIVLPILAALAGAAWPEPPPVELSNPDGQTLGLWWHRLVRLDPAGRAALLDARGSGDIIAAGQSDGFIEVPPHRPGTGPQPHPRYPFFRWPS